MIFGENLSTRVSRYRRVWEKKLIFVSEIEWEEMRCIDIQSSLSVSAANSGAN